MPDLKTLSQYKTDTEEALRQQPHQTSLSGIECPVCHEELDWDGGRSLITKVPPMRRLTCTQCGFSEVVPVADTE